MAQKCTHCGEDAVEEGGQYGQVHLICTCCGAVAEEGRLSVISYAPPSTFKDRTLAFRSKGRLGVGSGSCKSLSRGHKQGMEAITTLSSRLSLPFTSTQEAKDLYVRALKQPSIKTISVYKKLFLAASCVYVSLRQASRPISIVAICQNCGCSLEDFSLGYRLLVRALKLHTKQPPIEDVVESFLVDLDLGEERNEVVKRTVHTVRLASRLWLATGRSNAPLIHACAFFAWKSVSLDRSRTTFSRFCVTLKLQKCVSTLARVREVEGVLIELGKKIPWLDANDMTSSTVSLHLKDILRYSTSLRVDLCSDEQNAEVTTEIEDTEFRKFRKRRLPLRGGENNCKLDDTLSCEDIEDEEIEQYIRSEKEVEVIRKLHMKYDGSLQKE